MHKINKQQQNILIATSFTLQLQNYKFFQNISIVDFLLFLSLIV